MKNYTVVIPTTDYLVGISDIVIEDPLVSSVICENNNLEALPISNKYSSFVLGKRSNINGFHIQLLLKDIGNIYYEINFIDHQQQQQGKGRRERGIL